MQYLPAIAFVLDAVVITGVTAVAALGRDSWSWFDSSALMISDDMHILAPIVAVSWLLVTAFIGGYQRALFDVGTEEFRLVARAGLITAGVLGVGAFVAHYPLSRGFFVLLFCLGIPALLLERSVLRGAIRLARRRGSLQHTVLIVGSPASVDDVAAVLQRERKLGYTIIGALTPQGAEGETPGGLPVLGHGGEVTALVRKTGADAVFFAHGAVTSGDELRRIAWALEKDDVNLVVAPSVSEVSSGRIRVRPLGGLPLIHVDAPRVTDAARWGKRAFDIVGATALLVVTSPLFLYAALRIKLHDRGRVLFRQTRVGRDREEFGCLKFRTMVEDAEAQLGDLHAANGFSHGLFKMEDDPRITKPGQGLRRFSIDELPQLVNVLRGDMSLVGPRPPLPSEAAAYNEDACRRMRVRPGLTGLWQVSGRSDLSYEEAMRLDLFYVDNWSMVQDVWIMLKTIRAVFSTEGAY